jgi:hypothetical protein
MNYASVYWRILCRNISGQQIQKATLNYFNQSVFKYSGLTLEQIDAGGWLQIVHPDDREENIRLWMEAISSGNDFLLNTVSAGMMANTAGSLAVPFHKEILMEIYRCG